MNSTDTEIVPPHLDSSLNRSRSEPHLTQRHDIPHFCQLVYRRSFHYIEELYTDQWRSAPVRVVTVNYVEMDSRDEVPMEVDEAPIVERSEWKSLKLASKGPKQRLSHKSNKALASRQRVYFCTIPLALLISAVLYGLYNGATKDVVLSDLKRDLFDNVFEQELPIRALVLSIEQYPTWPRKVKTIVFSGTRGVGKTHLANVVRKHFSDNCVRDVLVKQLGETRVKKSIAASLRNHCLNLVIVDDLELKHDQHLFEFVDVIPDDCRALIIAIYNLYDDDDNLNVAGTLEDAILIENDYARSGLYYESLSFRQFDAAQVRRWVMQQLQGMNVTMGSWERIVENVLLGHDVVRNGLRGLHSKLLIEVQKEKKL